MSEKKLKILLPIIGVLAFISYTTMFTVNEIQQAIILQFGDPKRVIQKAGLNFKIPFVQNVVLLDKRILNLDAPSEEIIASDQKRLIVDAFARFKIKDPLKFYISVGNERVARSRLATVINSRIRNVLGQQELKYKPELNLCQEEVLLYNIDRDDFFFSTSLLHLKSRHAVTEFFDNIFGLVHLRESHIHEGIEVSDEMFFK